MSKTSMVPYVKQKRPLTRPAIDTANDTVPPLDFSFYKLTNISDVCDEEPRITSPRKETSQPQAEKGKSSSRSLRLNNNNLTDIAMLGEVVTNFFENPSILGWIDLSFNELTHIDPILAEFENLEILYLHGNSLAELGEVYTLQPLRKLRKLTLHGNPVENVKGYKQNVLSVLPWLLNFDFSPVTKCDRRTAETWNKTSNKGQKKKKKSQTDD